jgi:heme exporter protein A
MNPLPSPTGSAVHPSPDSRPLPLELNGIAHRFGRRWILRGLALRVHPGEVVAVVGSNGAGKTTLLRIAATLLRPTRGGGCVGDADLVEEPERVRASAALLAHSPSLYEDLTAHENLAFALRMHGREADARRIRDVLEEVGLVEHAAGRVRSFSAGMRRRVAVGRILLAPPALLLMDEPYASLDPQGVGVVNRLITGVRARGGGVVLATHDLESGAAVTDRILRLDQGRLGAASSGPEGGGLSPRPTGEANRPAAPSEGAAR